MTFTTFHCYLLPPIRIFTQATLGDVDSPLLFRRAIGSLRTPYLSLGWPAVKCPRFTFVDTIVVSTKAISLPAHVHTASTGRLPEDAEFAVPLSLAQCACNPQNKLQ